MEMTMKKCRHKWEYISGGEFDDPVFTRYRTCSKCKLEEYYDDYYGGYLPRDYTFHYEQLIEAK